MTLSEQISSKKSQMLHQPSGKSNDIKDAYTKRAVRRPADDITDETAIEPGMPYLE